VFKNLVFGKPAHQIDGHAEGSKALFVALAGKSADPVSILVGRLVCKRKLGCDRKIELRVPEPLDEPFGIKIPEMKGLCAEEL
jgi:hypothetical protein